MQDASYYKEAENMQPGWGKFLRRVDLLRARVDQNESIGFKDAFYILWCEHNSVSILKEFENWLSGLEDCPRKMPLPAWHGLFDHWKNTAKGVGQ